jgi:hypothetical protein
MAFLGVQKPNVLKCAVGFRLVANVLAYDYVADLSAVIFLPTNIQYFLP